MTNPAPKLVPLDGYYNRQSDDLWWAIFIRDNPRVDYEQNQVRVSQMIVNDDPTDKKRNTKGKLVAIPGRGREGEEWLTWNRPFMEELFLGKEVWIIPRGQTSVSEVMDDFNKIWKFQLTPRDYYDQSIEVISTPMTIQVQIRPTCLCFQGVLTIHIGVPDEHIGEMIVNRDLSGLDYPTHQRKKGQAPFYVWDRDFTFMGPVLRDQFGYDDIVSADQYELLEDILPHDWIMVERTEDWNLQGARVVYNGPTDKSPAPCDQSFENVMLLELDPVFCNNYFGHVNFHYNVLNGA